MTYCARNAATEYKTPIFEYIARICELRGKERPDFDYDFEIIAKTAYENAKSLLVTMEARPKRTLP